MSRKKRGLTQRKIWYIVKQKQGTKSTREIAEDLKVSPSTVKRVWTVWNRTRTYLILRKPGRPMKPITKEEEDIVLKAYGDLRLGARRLARVIKKKYGMNISHNRVHKILLKHSKAKQDPKKQKRRKPWVRFEREHSLSMVQMDWHESKINGKQVCAVLDDASRKIVAGGEFDNATANNSIALIKECIAKYGHIRVIREVLTDHGPQFWANKKANDGKGLSSFTIFLKSLGIKHILARVKHPQTCGKIEKWFDTYERHRGAFDTFEDFIKWYNTVRYHESLDTKWDMYTPEEAFWGKLPPECLLGMFWDKLAEVDV